MTEERTAAEVTTTAGKPSEEFRGLQREISKRDFIIKSLNEEKAKGETQPQTTQILAEIQSLKQTFAQQVQEQEDRIAELEEKREKEDNLGIETEQPQRASRRVAKRTARQLITDHGLNPYDAQFEEALEQTDPVHAINRKIAEIHKSEKATLKGEIDKIKLDTHEAELRAQSPQDKGEGANPSGGARSFQDIEAGYIAGRITRQVYDEARKKQGL